MMMEQTRWRSWVWHRQLFLGLFQRRRFVTAVTRTEKVWRWSISVVTCPLLLKLVSRRLSADARRPEDILRPEHRRRTLQDDYDEEATFRDGAPLRDREHRRRRQPDVDTLDSGDSSSAAASLTLTPYEFARRTRRCRIDFIDWMERAREGDSS